MDKLTKQKIALNMFSAVSFVSASIIWWQLNHTLSLILFFAALYYGWRTRQILDSSHS